MLNSFTGSLKHLAKGWLTPSDTKVKYHSDVCLRYFCDGYVIARLEDPEEAMNKFAIAAAKSPTIKDEVKLLLVILIYSNSDILGGRSSLGIRDEMDEPEFTDC